MGGISQGEGTLQGVGREGRGGGRRGRDGRDISS